MSVPPTDAKAWVTFTRKMKWVLLGTVATVAAAAVNALTTTVNVQDHPWVGIIVAALPFVLGYIPKEKVEPA